MILRSCIISSLVLSIFAATAMAAPECRPVPGKVMRKALADAGEKDPELTITIDQFVSASRETCGDIAKLRKKLPSTKQACDKAGAGSVDSIHTKKPVKLQFCEWK